LAGKPSVIASDSKAISKLSELMRLLRRPAFGGTPRNDTFETASVDRNSFRFFVDLELKEIYILLSTVFKNGRFYERAKG
jgi:hypothetical protein